jgi:tryptophanyl-tRNA synthetase
VDCKKLLAKNMNQALAPIRARRAELAAKPGYVKEVLDDGAKRARVIAQQTMQEVRQKIGL